MTPESVEYEKRIAALEQENMALRSERDKLHLDCLDYETLTCDRDQIKAEMLRCIDDNHRLREALETIAWSGVGTYQTLQAIARAALQKDKE